MKVFRVGSGSLVVAGLVWALMSSGAAWARNSAAPQPANDYARENTTALDETCRSSLVGTTVGATREAHGPRCGADDGRHGLVQLLRGAAPGTVAVSFQSAGQLDAVVAVYQIRQRAAQALAMRGDGLEGPRAVRLRDAPAPRSRRLTS